MKRNRTKLLACAACALALAMLLSSCGVVTPGPYFDTTAPSETTASPSGTDTSEPSTMTADKYLKGLLKNDFEGASFLIKTSVPGLFTDADIASEVNYARSARTLKVEEKYDIKIVSVAVDDKVLYEQMRDAVDAGEFYADMLAINVSEFGKYYASGALSRLDSLPFTDFDKPYFAAEAIDAASDASGVWGAVGDATVDVSSMSCLYFNKTLVGDGMYDLARNGTLTWDSVYTAAKDASASLDAVAQDAFVGFGYRSEAETIGTVISSSGVKYIGETEDAAKAILPYTETLDAILTTVRRTMYGDGTVKTSDYVSVMHAFSEGNVAFAMETLGTMGEIANMAGDWGILPIPKMTADGAYASRASGTAKMLVVPAYDKANADAAGMMLQAMNAASYGHFLDEFISDAMHSSLRDNDSIAMIRLIDAAETYDAAYWLGNAKDIANATFDGMRYAVQNDLTANAMYKRHGAKGEKKLAELFG